MSFIFFYQFPSRNLSFVPNWNIWKDHFALFFPVSICIIIGIMYLGKFCEYWTKIRSFFFFFLFSSSVQSLSSIWFFATPRTAASQASLAITNCWSFLKSMSIKLVIPSNHLIFYCSLLLLPSVISMVFISYKVAKILEFQFQYQYFQWIFRTYFL